MKKYLSITKNHLFKQLYLRGRNSVNPYFALYLRKNRPHETTGQNYVGITVGVKLGNAVVRNKVRRRIREIYRTHESEMKQGYHLVVVARNRCATASFAQMESHLLSLFDQIGLSENPKIPLKFTPENKGKPKSSNPQKKKKPTGNGQKSW